MERIHVSVRARPLSAEDAKSSPWRISGNSILIPNQSSKFDFDRIFGEECKNDEVYSCHTKDIVDAAVRGFNGTVFAYGQTSSGKTHTMRGSASEPGVIPLAVHDLFEIIQEEVDREFLLRMSYMEIYNEEINDLLAPEHRKLQIHESIERGIFVAGLREEIVASPDQVLGRMEFGESHRHIGETNMNLYSSRSHTIFRMIIESREKARNEDLGNSCDAVRVSVLNLVDLAGSERAAKTGAEGVRLKEGSHINKSLMTLGTVIKKLSEGVESQGGHVPYRDSKLTRILQPALGGNANTAIICNITLAQIHADETKSSLLFASRALRVTNCAHVNEILTDAALLKRQKKEIEDLRAKLLGSHSEHLEEEILNLRNALLKAELERERIALELEEEKKAQAEREKMLQEQARKIENLSSMVLCSTRSESHEPYKKDKRRDTWCPGNILRASKSEVSSAVQGNASVIKPGTRASDVAPLIPFEDLVNESSVVDPCMEEKDRKSGLTEDDSLPNPLSLLHITSRRKAASRKKSLEMENNNLADTQSQEDDLPLKVEAERLKSDMELDYIRRKLALAGSSDNERHVDNFAENGNVDMHQNQIQDFTESEAICLIKQLLDKIKMIHMKKSSSHKNLDGAVELAIEQTMVAREKYEELYSVFQEAKGVVELDNELQNCRLVDKEVECSDSLSKLLTEIQELVAESRNLTESVFSESSDASKCFFGVAHLLLDLRSSALQICDEIRMTSSCYQKLKYCLESKVDRLENEKIYLCDQSLDLRNRIEEVSSTAENSANASLELSEEHEVEKSEFLSYIQALEKEISCLSSCSLAKEKESLRKELDKIKAKLRDTEAKLKNSMQEKTRLEGEKACAEKENKLLRNQKTVLERDLSKRDSAFGKRRDSVADVSSNMFDTKRGWSPATAVDLMEDYKRLEVMAFEMETKIASLEEELLVAAREKEAAVSTAEGLSCELNALSEKFNMSNMELTRLKGEVTSLKSCVDEYKYQRQDLQCSISKLEEEKEELSTQLADALLLLEEEKSIWCAKEKASLEGIEQNVKMRNNEVNLLLKEASEVKEELDFCRNECKILEERWKHSEERLELEKNCSSEKSLEIGRLQEDLKALDDHSKRTHESLNSQLDTLSLEHRLCCDKLEKLQMELESLHKGREENSSQFAAPDGKSVLSNKLVPKEDAGEFRAQQSSLEDKVHTDEAIANKEKAKLRMRLRGTQIKLDTYRYRYKEIVNEMDVMDRNYEAGCAKLKNQAISYGVEVMNLKKQLASCSCKRP